MLLIQVQPVFKMGSWFRHYGGRSLSAGDAANQFNQPKVFVDTERNLFVADFYNSRIQNG
jgi:hypothetical protein